MRIKSDAGSVGGSAAGAASRVLVGRRTCGVLGTRWVLLTALLANPPLQSRSVETFACEVSGRSEDVPVSREPTHHEEHPWQVALFRDGRFACSGILIDTEWVLATGACVAGNSSQSLAVGHGLTDLSEPGTVARLSRHPVREVRVHPEFDRTILKNDIALLRLAVPVVDARDSHANLPKGETRALERAGTCAVVTGWGAPTGSRISRLNVANARIMSREECRSAYGGSRISFGDICAGVPWASVTTYGDSGGALTVRESSNGLRWLVGVASWSAGEWGKPDPKPDVYMRVAHYRGWIERTMSGSRERPREGM